MISQHGDGVLIRPASGEASALVEWLRAQEPLSDADKLDPVEDFPAASVDL